MESGHGTVPFRYTRVRGVAERGSDELVFASFWVISGDLMKAICTIFGHHRSVTAAKRNFETDQWESVCRHCGMPMVRISHHRWRLKDSPETGGLKGPTDLTTSS